MSVDLGGVFLGPCLGFSVLGSPLDVESVHLDPGEFTVVVGIEFVPAFDESLADGSALGGDKLVGLLDLVGFNGGDDHKDGEDKGVEFHIYKINYEFNYFQIF